MAQTFIAQEFTTFYYATFDGDRSALRNLYRPTSMLSFEGSPVMGVDAIVEKLVNLPFKQVAHRVATQDAQPSSPSVASIIVSVTGQLIVDDSEHPLNFSQVFHLVPDDTGYYVLNDIFRLNYG
ncbi:nuclear transport factor 2 [Rickenella mellea]|uniref:Nuclear transport factor 2 n=1 Tax=Rickenella mellea TaxID=50990 RepID=A0A4Y7QJV8_9AGAM|nr:nuclear transport factor 2 [Rickenella mellea]